MRRAVLRNQYKQDQMGFTNENPAMSTFLRTKLSTAASTALQNLKKKTKGSLKGKKQKQMQLALPGSAWEKKYFLRKN